MSLPGSCHWYETSFSLSSSIDPCKRVKTNGAKDRVGEMSLYVINNPIGALLQTIITCLQFH